MARLPLSPLLTIAINLNQWISDALYRYHPILYWHLPTQSFRAETEVHKYFLWAFSNFVLISGIGGPCAFYGLVDAFISPSGKYKIFELFILWIQFVFAMGISSTAVTLGRNGESLASFYNQLFQFHRLLQQRKLGWCQSRLTHKIHKEHFPMSNKYVRTAFLPSGQVDILGVAAILIILAYAVVPSFFPILTLYLCVDSPYFLLRNIFPLEYRSILAISLIFVFRTTVVIFCVVEACITFRTMALYAILLLYSVSKCLDLLKVPLSPLSPTSFRPLTKLRILFTISNETYSVLATVYLIMMFLLLVLCNTLCCVLLPVISENWQIYFFGPLIGTLTTVILLVLFGLVVSVDDSSRKLITQWSLACAQNRCKNIGLIRRFIATMRPIAFTYSSFGTFKRATRRDYLYAVLSYSINCILPFRNKFRTPI